MPDDGFNPFGSTARDARKPADGPPAWFDAEAWDEAGIPPRPWIAPGYFLRGAVTTLIGPGGVSKSSLVVAWVMALAFGLELGGMNPHEARFRSVLYNVEDDADEQRRRLSATLTSMGKTPADLADWVLRSGPTQVGTLFEADDLGAIYPTPAFLLLERELVAFGAEVLFVDPLAELHGVEENDNGAMRRVVAAFRALAVRLNIAVVIIHHTRKGIHVPGDAEAGRGASAISGASRVVLTITSMTDEEAKAFGLSGDARSRHFRPDGGKSNYASLAAAEWYERSLFLLKNGDTVAVTVPWNPPVDALTTEVRAKVEAAVRAGHLGAPLSPQLGNTPRSVRHAMVAAGVVTKPGQQDMLAELLKAGFVHVRFKDRHHKKWTNGLRSPDGYPVAEWEDGDKLDDDTFDAVAQP